MRNTIYITMGCTVAILGLVLSGRVHSELDGITASREIQYRKLQEVDPSLLSLDVYAPNGAENLPVVMMVHGGGWRNGDKSNPGLNTTKPQAFCANGYVYVSINYRLSPAVEHPAHIEDVAAALHWLVDNIAGYGGDPSRISIMGHSAGAHLVALLGTNETRLAAEGLTLDDIESVICLDGAGYDIPARMAGRPGRLMSNMLSSAFGNDGSKWADASPTLHVQSGVAYPPFLILHTPRVDAPGQSMALGNALRDSGSYAYNAQAADKTHRTINRDIGMDDDWVTDLILDFLADGIVEN
jgi:acetyl esterase/lipase